MTRKIIELKQAPVVLVELPEGSTRHRMQSIIGVYRMDYLVYDLPNNNNTFIGLPIGVDHEIVGLLSDLTEEQFAECVPKEMYSHITNPKAIWYEVYLYSLLESENVYTENPYGEDQRSYSEFMDGVCRDKLAEDMRLWQEAQSRTIDPARTLVLLRKKETE